MSDTSVSVQDKTSPGRSEATRGQHYFTPRVDIFETDSELLLQADVPGVRPEDVDLRYDQGELILHARVPARSTGRRFLVREYEEGDFFRAFTVHESIDSTRISAECKNGVLTVHLPKAAPHRTRQVPVNAG